MGFEIGTLVRYSLSQTGTAQARRRRGEEPPSRSRRRRRGIPCARTDGAEIIGRGLLGSSVYNKVKRDLLSLVEAAHSGAFDRADVHEDVLATVIWLDKSEALLGIEPLHGSLRHNNLSFRWHPQDTPKTES
jgi:hypothetical protein